MHSGGIDRREPSSLRLQPSSSPSAQRANAVVIDNREDKQAERLIDGKGFIHRRGGAAIYLAT
jgi:hypothetical protein